uniref:Uncharacterized protein n=1 Tax=Haptolina ericina TaxID=156174 RepID=A0A7S3EYY0_9EUKA
MPDLERIYYATFPTIRVQTPSSSIATIRPHIDGIYGLQAGSLNIWLPLTEVEEVSALWVESSVGSTNFCPITRPTRFDGRRRVHFTIPNRSRMTRVSLDFRVVPGGGFDPASRLAQMGYFSAASLVRADHGGAEGADCRWVKTMSGHISELHGLPHTGKPTRH